MLLSAAWFATPPLHAQTPSTLTEVRLVGDIHQTIPFQGGGTVFSDDDGFFVINPATGTGQAFSVIGPQPHVGIDGYANVPSGGACPAAEYFSVDGWADVTPLVRVRAADVFFLFGKVLDAAAAGVPDGVNVDAVSVDPVTCDLVVSIDVVATLGGTVYKPDDLIRWNGTAFSLYRALNFGVNIDALHIISDTRFLYSIDSDGMVPGLVVQDDDVIESIPNGLFRVEVLAFSPRLFDSSWIASDVVGLSARVAGPLTDLIFADGFEE